MELMVQRTDPYDEELLKLTRQRTVVGEFRNSFNDNVCSGKLHYFDCAHVETCQCGRVKRVMPAKENG